MAHMDTFRPAQLQAIPGSNMITVVDRDKGFYLYDMQENRITQEFKISNYD